MRAMRVRRSVRRDFNRESQYRRPPWGHSKFESVVAVTQAKQALTTLGFTRAEAVRYVDQALAKVERPDLELLIRTALACSRQGVT